MTPGRRAYFAEYYRKNADKIRAAVAQRKRNNPEKIAAENARYYKKNAKRRAESGALWRKNNPEKAAAMAARSRVKNKKQRAAAQAAYQKRHPERGRASSSRHAKANPAKRAALQAKRDAAKLRATPAWVNAQAIVAVYELAAALTELTGIPHQVDHQVPLRSKLVSGLHVEHNLRVIPARDNSSKGNRFWSDMP